MYEKNVGFFLGVQTVQALLVHIFQKKKQTKNKSDYRTLYILSMSKDLLNVSLFQVRSARKETKSRISNGVYVICTMTWSN